MFVYVCPHVRLRYNCTERSLTWLAIVMALTHASVSTSSVRHISWPSGPVIPRAIIFFAFCKRSKTTDNNTQNIHTHTHKNNDSPGQSSFMICTVSGYFKNNTNNTRQSYRCTGSKCPIFQNKEKVLHETWSKTRMHDRCCFGRVIPSKIERRVDKWMDQVSILRTRNSWGAIVTYF